MSLWNWKNPSWSSTLLRLLVKLILRAAPPLAHKQQLAAGFLPITPLLLPVHHTAALPHENKTKKSIICSAPIILTLLLISGQERKTVMVE